MARRSAASSVAGGTHSTAMAALASIRRRIGLVEARMSAHASVSPLLSVSGMGGRRADRRLMTAAAVSSIERRVTSITGQPWSAHSRAHLDQLGIDGVAVDIVVSRFSLSVSRRLRRIWAMRSGLAIRPTTSGPSSFNKLGRRLEAGHQRDVGGLVAAIGEIDAGRRLRRPADADEDDVGLVEILRMLAVIMHHGEVERVDSPEIVGIEDVLAANTGPRLGIEIGGKTGNDRVEHRQAGNAERAEAAFERPRSSRSTRV